MKWINRFVAACVAMFAAIACPTQVFAQSAATSSYPNRPVRIVVPFAAGGGLDFVARIIAINLSETLGQPVVVDNKPGGSTAIGANLVAKAAPDGYTLLACNTTQIQAPAIRSNLPYDFFRDFTPVIQTGSTDDVLLVSKDLPVQTTSELVAYIKAHPKQGGYGSYGAGTSSHLHGDLFRSQANLDLVHAPYSGGALLLTALLGNQVAFGFVDISGARSQLNSGKLRVLGITGRQRSKLLPDVPTMTEMGYKNFEPQGYAGLCAPAGTPKEIVKKVADQVARILLKPEVAQKFYDVGLVPVGSTSEEFATMLKHDAKIWAEIATAGKIRID